MWRQEIKKAARFRQYRHCNHQVYIYRVEMYELRTLDFCTSVELGAGETW